MPARSDASAEPIAIIPRDPPRSRRAAIEIHAFLRQQIVSGEIDAGTVLSQVGVARKLGVSRTPVREALRMLQEEGMVTAEPNYRARVPRFDPDELDGVFAHRIVAECFALGLSVPRMSDSDLAALDRSLAAIAACEAGDDIKGWIAEHRDFHLRLVARAGKALRQLCEKNYERAQRCQVAYFHGRGWSGRRHRHGEHHAIVDACRARRPGVAVTLLAEHIARTAFRLMGDLAPGHPTAAVEAACRFVADGARASGELPAGVEGVK